MQKISQESGFSCGHGPVAGVVLGTGSEVDGRNSASAQAQVMTLATMGFPGSIFLSPPNWTAPRFGASPCITSSAEE